THVFFISRSAPTETSTLSLHDALPIFRGSGGARRESVRLRPPRRGAGRRRSVLEDRIDSERDEVVAVHALDRLDSEGQLRTRPRSEEHTSELQSRSELVCRLLLEKKKG